jgi:hypothetical protein
MAIEKDLLDLLLAGRDPTARKGLVLRSSRRHGLFGYGQQIC